MSGQDLFGVLVRYTGVLAVAYGIYTLIGIIDPPQGFTRIDYLLGSIPIAVIGFILLLGANSIVKFAYDSDDENSEDISN